MIGTNLDPEQSPAGLGQTACLYDQVTEISEPGLLYRAIRLELMTVIEPTQLNRKSVLPSSSYSFNLDWDLSWM